MDVKAKRNDAQKSEMKGSRSRIRIRSRSRGVVMDHENILDSTWTAAHRVVDCQGVSTAYRTSLFQ